MTKMKYIQYVWFHHKNSRKELLQECDEEISRFGYEETWDSRVDFLLDEWEGKFGDVIYKEIL